MPLLIRDLVSRIERPWLLVADRLGLVGGTYVLRTRDGSAFEVRGGTSDRFSVFEIAIRRDYFSLVNIKPGDVIVDVGANIGIFTVIASKLVGSHGRVVAIEPNSESAKRLERNIALNSLNNVTVYELRLLEQLATLHCSLVRRQYFHQHLIKKKKKEESSCCSYRSARQR